MINRRLTLVAVLITSVSLAAESPVKVLGPEVGHRFPHTLAAVDQAGKAQSLGRGRAKRWMTPPVGGFTTTLLLPAPLPGA